MFNELKDHGVDRIHFYLKKLFFDWLKMNAIWARREMVEYYMYHFRRNGNDNAEARSPPVLSPAPQFGTLLRISLDAEDF